MAVEWPNATGAIGGRAWIEKLLPRAVVAWKIPIPFIQKLFTREFWMVEVKQRGRGAFVPDCHVGFPWDSRRDSPACMACAGCNESLPEDCRFSLPRECCMDGKGNIWKKVDRPDLTDFEDERDDQDDEEMYEELDNHGHQVAAVNLNAHDENAVDDRPNDGDESREMSKLNRVELLRLTQVLNEAEALFILQNVSKVLRDRRRCRKG